MGAAGRTDISRRDGSYGALGHTTIKGRGYRQSKCYPKGPGAVTSFEGARTGGKKADLREITPTPVMQSPKEGKKV